MQGDKVLLKQLARTILKNFRAQRGYKAKQPLSKSDFAACKKLLKDVYVVELRRRKELQKKRVIR